MALTVQNPTGNVPLLVFRVIEHLAVRHIGEEWPLSRPHVARLVGSPAFETWLRDNLPGPPTEQSVREFFGARGARKW